MTAFNEFQPVTLVRKKEKNKSVSFVKKHFREKINSAACISHSVSTFRFQSATLQHGIPVCIPVRKRFVLYNMSSEELAPINEQDFKDLKERMKLIVEADPKQYHNDFSLRRYLRAFKTTDDAFQVSRSQIRPNNNHYLKMGTSGTSALNTLSLGLELISPLISPFEL